MSNEEGASGRSGQTVCLQRDRGMKDIGLFEYDLPILVIAGVVAGSALIVLLGVRAIRALRLFVRSFWPH